MNTIFLGNTKKDNNENNKYYQMRSKTGAKHRKKKSSF